MSDHAKLSPSSRYRWSACPGSVKACEKYEKEGRKSSPSAIDGTHSHTLLEQCVHHAKQPKQYSGMVLFDHEGGFAVDDARIERVTVATNYIEERLVELAATHGTCKAFAEAKVDPQPMVGRDDMSGTVDVHLVAGRYLELIDYKDGVNKVEAEGNQQLEQYLVGVFAKYLKGEVLPFDRVRMTIIQPKLTMFGQNPISFHEVDASAAVPEIIAALIREGKAVDDPNAPRVPGQKQCAYCPNGGNCSEYINFTLGNSGIKFADMTMAQQAAQKELTEIDDATILEIVEAAPMLRKMLEVVEAEALRRLQSGHPIEGLKVVRGNGRRQWVLPEEETAAKLTKMGVPKGEIWQTSLISPAGVEKLKWTKRDGTEKQLSPRQMEVVEKELVSKSEGKLTVAPVADRRPAVEFKNVEAMFAPTGDNVPSWLS
jgi:hypothetical protein